MIKPLFFVLAISTLTAWLTRRYFADLLTPAYHHRALLLFAVGTSVLFLSPGPWVFLVTFAGVLWVGTHLESTNPTTNLAIFLLFLPAVPPVTGNLSGFGGIQNFLDMNPLRVATIVLLIPACLDLMNKVPPGSKNPFITMDIAVLGYEILQFAHKFNDISGTSVAREIVIIFLDVWIPYYSFSRGIRTANDFKFIVGHFVLVCTLIGGIAIFESQKNWSFYNELQAAYGQWTLTNVLMRGDFLRARATTTQPTTLAIIEFFGIALFFAMHPSTWRQQKSLIVLLFLFGGLIVTMSRGTWIGAGLMLMSLYFLYRTPIARYRAGLILSLFALIAAKGTGLDDYIFEIFKVIFGSKEEDIGSIEYRRELLETSLVLISYSPWFGVPNYAAYMQHLVQGEGIIDMVNVYLSETLDHGLTGLAVYVAPFLIGILAMLKWLAKNPDESKKPHINSMLSATIGFLVIIFTTSTTQLISLMLMMTYSISISQIVGSTPQKRFPWE